MVNAVYLFKCPLEDCYSKNMNYIGHTRTTLGRRLTGHQNTSSAICKHLEQEHNIINTTSKQYKELLKNNTNILKTCNNYQRLTMLEALIIKSKNPTINKINFDNSSRILHLF